MPSDRRAIEPTDSWQDIAPDTADEVADNQGFVEGILREGLDDPLINQGYEYMEQRSACFSTAGLLLDRLLEGL